jgi:cytochrome c peroxidase
MARLEELYQQYKCITYADLYSWSGSVAVANLGGPQIVWRSGRRDFKDYPTKASFLLGSAPYLSARLPNPDFLAADYLSLFKNKYGLTEQEIVALVGGAHGLGQ